MARFHTHSRYPSCNNGLHHIIAKMCVISWVSRAIIVKISRHFSIIVRHLFNLLKQNTRFVWIIETRPSIYWSSTQRISTRHSWSTWTHRQRNRSTTRWPSTTYMSKPLGPRIRGLSAYEKGCLVVLMGIEQWRPHLQQQEVVIRTRQKSAVLEHQILYTI